MLLSPRNSVTREPAEVPPTVAVPSILVIAYHIPERRADYEELGGDYFDRQTTEHLQRRLIRRPERLGLKVVVEPLAEAA